MRDRFVGIACGWPLWVAFCFVLGADKAGPDKTPAPVAPHYSVQFTPSSMVITDNEKNKVYVYASKDGKLGSDAVLFRTLDLSDAGKREIIAIKPPDEQK
jgi:hypothetical protein